MFGHLFLEKEDDYDSLLYLCFDNLLGARGADIIGESNSRTGPSIACRLVLFSSLRNPSWRSPEDCPACWEQTLPVMVKQQKKKTSGTCCSVKHWDVDEVVVRGQSRKDRLKGRNSKNKSIQGGKTLLFK